MNLRFPQSGTVTSLFGNVVWKRQSGSKCMAGIKFKGMDKKARKRMAEKISSAGAMPSEAMHHRKEIESREEHAEKPASSSAEKEKKSAKRKS